MGDIIFEVLISPTKQIKEQTRYVNLFDMDCKGKKVMILLKVQIIIDSDGSKYMITFLEAMEFAITNIMVFRIMDA